MTLKPIPNWKRAWRMLTVHVATLALGFGLMTPEQQAGLLDLLGVAPERAPAVLGLMFLAARLIDQPKTREGE